MKHLRWVSLWLLLLCAQSLLAAEPPVFSTLLDGAIHGYDPVAYFTDGRPIKGIDTHKLEYMGTVWKFSSAKNRAAFEAMPDSYAPQYGGYCAYAVSRGYTASIDPEAWTIVDGRLYLNYSQSVRESWSQDIPGNIKKADGNWPALLGG